MQSVSAFSDVPFRTVLVDWRAWCMPCSQFRSSMYHFTWVELFQICLPCYLVSNLAHPQWAPHRDVLAVNVASYLLINRNPNSLRPPRTSFNTAIFLLIFSIVVFRAELALFLGPLALQALVQGHTTFTNLIKIGLISGLFSIGITKI